MTTTTQVLTITDRSADYAGDNHDYDLCRVWCSTCGRDVSTGMRYQLANGHDADQHVRLFHGSPDKGYTSAEPGACPCDFCREPAAFIDTKGYVYCDSHKIAGRGRKLTAAERAGLARGEQVAKY